MLKEIFVKIFFKLFLWKHRKEFPDIPNVVKGPPAKLVGGEKLVEVRPETPKEGGLLTHFPHQKFPFPGFPDKRIVYKVGFAKRLIPVGVDWMHKQIEPFIPKNPHLYCRPVREIYRLFNIYIERDGCPKTKKLFAKIRDVICVYAEYDDSYRFRGQDVAGEVKLEELILQDADRWWFLPKDYNFKGKKEFDKKYGYKEGDD